MIILIYIIIYIVCVCFSVCVCVSVYVHFVSLFCVKHETWESVSPTYIASLLTYTIVISNADFRPLYCITHFHY